MTRSKRILITDDALFMRTLMRGILSARNVEIVEAENGQEAILQYETHRPDLVFMDITMPIMDGITATKGIRALDPHARIVMCTAMGQQNMILEAIRAGAQDFIVKPFDPERVLECIDKLEAEAEAA